MFVPNILKAERLKWFQRNDWVTFHIFNARDDPEYYRVILRMHNKANKGPDVVTMPISKMIYVSERKSRICKKAHSLS